MHYQKEIPAFNGWNKTGAFRFTEPTYGQNQIRRRSSSLSRVDREQQ